MTNPANEQKWDEEEIALSPDKEISQDLIDTILYAMNRTREISPESAPKEDMIILVAPDIGNHVYINVPVSQPAYVMLPAEVEEKDLPHQEIRIPDISDEATQALIVDRDDQFDKMINRGMKKVLLCGAGGIGLSAKDRVAAIPTCIDLETHPSHFKSQPWYDRGGSVGKGGKVKFPHRNKCNNQYRGRGRNR